MSIVNGQLENKKLEVSVTGSVDSGNAAEMEAEILSLLGQGPVDTIVVDLQQMGYCSSAGLRVFLRLKQKYDDLHLINASPDVYGILDMTGFTDMMDVQKAYRVLSVEGCDAIGKGAYGSVYRIDRDTIVKVYLKPDSLEDIHRERELARAAFVAGVPTALPYDVVRIESGGYGSVFELLNSKSFAELLIRKEKPLEEMAALSVKLLKTMHSKIAKPGSMPSMKATALKWADLLAGVLAPELSAKLRGLLEAVPDDMHMMHGDFHIKNIMLQDGEALLIDMDTLCHGHPVFELGFMFNAYCGYNAADPEEVKDFLGIDSETAAAFWRKCLELYLSTAEESVLRDVENKAKIVGFTRILRWPGRTPAQEAVAKKTLEELLPVTDTLLF